MGQTSGKKARGQSTSSGGPADPKVDGGVAQLRKREILTLIAEQVAIPMDLLAQFLRLSRADTEKLMEEFAKHRWVKAKKFFVHDEPWVWLRRAGADQSGSGLRPLTPNARGLPHRRAVCVARLRLEAMHPEGTWLCGRRLWRRHGMDESRRVPDGALVLQDEEGRIGRLAVVVELTANAADHRREVAVDPRFDYNHVLYLCTARVGRKLRQIEGVGDSPEVSIHEVFEESWRVEQFQWEWSEWSGPGEASPSRPAEPWEVEVVRLISEQAAVAVDQLAGFLGCDEATAQWIANHLDAAGFVCQGRGPVEDPPWLWTTKAGGRVAGTELKAWNPTPTMVAAYRQTNEARLRVLERDPTIRWWSKLLLRRGENEDVPAAILEAGKEHYLVEVENAKRERAELIEKYVRRCDEFPIVVVFCSARRVPMFERLKEECGLDNMFVSSLQGLR